MITGFWPELSEQFALGQFTRMLSAVALSINLLGGQKPQVGGSVSKIENKKRSTVEPRYFEVPREKEKSSK